jgi:hypothetical protein
MVSPDGRATLIDFGLQCHGVCEYPALPDSDTYSLGQLLYEALIGARPSGPRPVNLPENLEWPTPPRKLNPNVWGRLEHVVMKAISPKTEDRYPTAAVLQAELDELAKPKSRVASLVLMGLMALMIVGVSIWYFGAQARSLPDDRDAHRAGTNHAVLGGIDGGDPAGGIDQRRHWDGHERGTSGRI